MSRYGTQQPYEVLVANLTGQYDAQKNPIKARTGFVVLPLLDEQGRTLNAYGTGHPPTQSTAEVIVSDADFSTGEAILWIGDYTLETTENWTPTNGNANQSATDLAAAIDTLPGFSASAVAATVTILGPLGSIGGTLTFKAAYTGTKVNYSLTPTDGYMLGGNPSITGGGIIP